MFCPVCGTQCSGEQKYCRACGKELESIAAMISARAPGAPEPFEPAGPEWETSFRAIRKISAGLSFLFVGIALAALGGPLFHNDSLRGLGTVLSVWGVFSIVLSLVKRSRARSKTELAARTQANTQPHLKAPPAPIPRRTDAKRDRTRHSPHL